MPTVVVLEAEENSLERWQWMCLRKEKGETEQEISGYKCRKLKGGWVDWQYRDSQPAVSLAGSICSA